jgi:hypothetical protein
LTLVDRVAPPRDAKLNGAAAKREKCGFAD